MAENPVSGRGGGDAVELGGYQQELKRTLGSFQVFAISFAFISVAVGIFATYDDVLQNAGPVGIWLWIIAAIGQTLVALVVAQFAARIPLSGSSYQWASRLANPKVGWGFGWLSFCYLGVAVVAIANALASQAFMPLLGMRPDEGTARVITLVVLFAQTVIAIASTRLVSFINTLAVGLEVVLVVVVAVALVLAVVITGDGEAGNLVSRGVTEDVPGYFAIGGGLMIAMIMGLSTLVGFDSAANLAEEAKDPYRTVPRAIVASVVAAGVLGMLFLIALTAAIDDIPKVTQSGSPVAAILRVQLGPAMEKVLLVAITIAFFGAGVVAMVACARLVFAMARDGRFPASRLMRRVGARTCTPIPATILIFALGVALMVALPGMALLELITAGTILPALTYAATIVLYLSVRRRLSRQEGAFDLGRFEMPVAVCALVWTVVALIVLVSPREALVSIVIVVGLLLAGAVFFLIMLKCNRSALESEPGRLPL
ncbi:APC family permease [Streptomyces sp. NPDC101206]|uniref:APC family permease n=1 Tax=Streptomyces sp. NPDC101206 TaxID=3366128 RepID=UPI00382F4950